MRQRFETHGRRPAVLMTVIAVWAGLIVLVLALDMAIWIAAILALATLPALSDWFTNRTASIEVHTGGIDWQSGRHHGQFPMHSIRHLRLDRRMDGSYRLSIQDANGRTHRLPPDIAPPPGALEAALDAAGIAHQRHPFSILPR